MRRTSCTILTAVVFTACGVIGQARGAAIDRAIPAPLLDPPAASGAKLEKAVLAGGCFWGLQGMYEHVKGVSRVVAGYSGGDKATAHYEMVGTERTGHAESIEITYDPKQVTYGKLLQLFFSVAHDPTQLNRQDPDDGPSYRSEIFYASPAQQQVAKAYIAQLTKAKIFSSSIVTLIEPLKAFYPAEDYHQDFLIIHPDHPYIVHYDLPKIAALKRIYPALYRAAAVRVR
jgi:peptide-methionine (S)-S-oxide reductase